MNIYSAFFEEYLNETGFVCRHSFPRSKRFLLISNSYNFIRSVKNLILNLKPMGLFVDELAMLNVFARNFFLLLISAVLLTSCKETDLEVSSLGKKLPAPALKGTSPFDQNFDSQNYVRLQGSCDTRIGNVFISFDKELWHQPPQNPDVTGTSLPAATTNDRDCSSDGTFDIYLTKNDLLNWGIQPGNDSVDYIYVKGESLIGDTETLTLVNNHNGGGGNGNGDSTPAKLLLEKNWPVGFAGSGQCEGFRVSVVNSAGYRVKATSNVTVQLGSLVSLSSSVSSTLSVYTRWEDCGNSSATTVDSVVIPAGNDGVDLIYKFPSGPLDSIFYFRVTGDLLSPSSSIAVKMRDSSIASTYRWIASDEPLHQIYKDVCYPLNLRVYAYNKSAVSDSYSGAINLSSTDTAFKTYSDATCSSAVSSYSIYPGVSLIPVYVKYTSLASETSGFKEIAFSVTTATGSNYNYDFSDMKVRVDLGSKNTATRIDLWGPQYMKADTCQSFRIVTTNDNGTLLPASSDISVQLSTNITSAGNFYASDTSCSAASAPVTSVSMGPPAISRMIYFRAGGTAGTYQAQATSVGLTSSARDIVIQP